MYLCIAHQYAAIKISIDAMWNSPHVSYLGFLLLNEVFAINITIIWSNFLIQFDLIKEQRVV